MSSYLVTGAARGIGFALVKKISQDPSNDAYALVRGTSDVSLLEKLERPNVIIVRADISSYEEVKKAFEFVASQTEKLDVLIANAAYMPKSRDTVVDIENFEAFKEETIKSIHFNVFDQINLVNTFLSLLEKGERRQIAFMSSGLAALGVQLKSGFPYSIPYSLSKAALNFISEKYAVSLKPNRFTVLSISPGLVSSWSQEPQSEDEVLKYLGPIIPYLKSLEPGFKGPITPSESAEAVLKTIGYASPHLTGKFISQFGSEHEWL